MNKKTIAAAAILCLVSIFNIGSQAVFAWQDPTALPPEGGGSFIIESGSPANVIYIKADGTVGVGTTTPGVKLDVGTSASDLIRSYGGFTGNAAANIGGTGAAAYFPNGLWSSGPAAWIYGSVTFNGALAGATSLSVTGNGTFTGNLGVGAVAPGTPLHVSTTGADILRIERTGSAANVVYSAKNTAGTTYFGRPTTNFFAIGSSLDLALNPYLSIGTTGAIGIGTTAAAAKLAINGGLHVGGDSDPGDNNALIDGTLTVTGNANICNLVAYTSGSGTVSCPAGFYTWSGVGLTSGYMLCCKVSNPI